MAKSDRLFELVHSLSVNEKRYFRMFVELQTSQKERNYLRIFDTLVKMEHYDGEKLRREFRGESILRHLSSEKHYLFRLILRVMRMYRAGSSRRFRLSGLIQDAIFLYEKMMYEASADQFAKAKELALEIEDLPQLYHILAWERKLLKRLPPKDPVAGLEQLIREKDELLAGLAGEAEYHDLYDRLFLTLQRAGAPENQERLQALRAHPLLEAPLRTPSFLAAHLRHEVRALHFRLAGDTAGMAGEYDKLIAHWEGRAVLIDEDGFVFQAILSNALAVHSLLRHHKEVEQLLNKMNALRPRSAHARFNLKQSLFLQELVFCLNSGQFERAYMLVPRIDNWLKQHGEGLGNQRRQSFLLNMALSCFFAGHPSGALKYARRLQDTERAALRPDIQRFLPLFLLMLHHDLDHTELLDSLLRSARRYLHKQGGIQPFEEHFLSGIRKVMRAVPPAKDEWKALAESLGPGQTGQPAGQQEIRYWVESKVSGLPIGEIAAQPAD